MFEWSLMLTLAEKLVLVAMTIICGLLIVIGSFVSKDRRRREKLDDQLYGKIDAIFEQVNQTNGQVIMLQEWRQNFAKETEQNLAEIKTNIGDMFSRLVDKSSRRD